MNKTQIKQYIKKIQEADRADDFDLMNESWNYLVQELFKTKQFGEIAELFKKEIVTTDWCTSFEAAYALADQKMDEDAETIYEFLLYHEPDNTAVLNNLSNIKKKKWETQEAFEMIEKAYKITWEKDEIIKNNYDSLLKIINEKSEVDSFYRNAESSLKKETEWAREKLNNFLISIEKEKKFKDQKIDIPRRKFKVFIWTDEQKANSLREQRLDKGYIRDTGNRTEHNVTIYEVNPYLKKFISTNTPIAINKEWMKGFEKINGEELEKIKYSTIVNKIEKVNKKYKEYLKRDFDELVFNYLVNNRKSVIILSWSFVELLFTYFCEKNKLSSLSYTVNSKLTKRELYDCTLSDFLRYFEEQKKFKQSFIYIGNLSRVFRNFIHPWNEIKEKESLDNSKVELCFNATLEFINHIL